MAFYDWLFDNLGLRDWCDGAKQEGPMSMAELLAKAKGNQAAEDAETFPFPSLDALHEACGAMPRTREMTVGLERLFLDVKDGLKVVLDPITQPLSWMLDGALWLFASLPWWVLLPLLLMVCWTVTRNVRVALLVAFSFILLGFIDHLDSAVQTLSIIFVCTTISVVLGVPIGIAMSKSDRLQKTTLPILDLLQTLPSFVYLIPLIFLFFCYGIKTLRNRYYSLRDCSGS